MPARRCSICSLDYDTDHTGPCRVCDGALSFFQNVEPDPDLEESIRLLVWASNDYAGPMYGGTTVMTRFERELEHLIGGADDFLFACGEWAPKGHDD